MTRWFWGAVLLVVAALSVTGYVWLFQFERLPDPMPTHWNIRGEPDQWMPRDRAFALNFLLSPLLMVLMIGLTVALPWLSPRGFRIDTWRSTFEYMMFLVSGLFGFIHVCLVFSSLDPKWNLGFALVSGMFLFFALMGNVMGKIRKNFYAGVKTPWTLASDAVWIQTHRVTAWIWVATGITGAVLVLALRSEWVILAAAVGLLIAAFAPVPYSYFLYKRLEREGKL